MKLITAIFLSPLFALASWEMDFDDDFAAASLGTADETLYGVIASGNYWYAAPSIVDGVLFGRGDIDGFFNPAHNTWEICVFGTPADSGGLRVILSEKDKDYTSGKLTFFFPISSKLAFCSEGVYTELGVAPVASEESGFKIAYDGSKYTVQQFSNGIWGDVLIAYTGFVDFADGINLVLSGYANSGWTFYGGVNLRKSYVKIGNTVWWEGEKGAYMLVNQ